MSDYCSVSVRAAQEVDAVAKAMCRLAPCTPILEDGWVTALFDTVAMPSTKQLVLLSSELDGEVVLLAWHSVVNAFVFGHWQGGRTLRVLEFACDPNPCWSRVEGEPESWEQFAFWSRSAFIESLDDATNEEERREVEKVWSEGLIRRGSSQPVIVAEDTIDFVRDHYGF